MGSKDPRIDAYIEKSADFAQPVLRYIREVVHAACPEVVETMKWSFPHFDYKGIMVSMAAFKAHCSLNFWHARDVMGPDAQEGAMGQFGRITSVKDLPSKKALAGYVKKAMALKDAGAKPSWAVGRSSKAKATGKAATAASTWSGSPRRSGRRPGRSAWPRPWNGSPRESPGTGSTSRRSLRRDARAVYRMPVSKLMVTVAQTLSWTVTTFSPAAGSGSPFTGASR